MERKGAAPKTGGASHTRVASVASPVVGRSAGAAGGRPPAKQSRRDSDEDIDDSGDDDDRTPRKPARQQEEEEAAPAPVQVPQEVEEPMFRVEKLEWRPSREQGSLVSLAVGSNVLLIGTENCQVIRWNVETDEFEEIVISKKPLEDKIHKVFMDPTGNHALVSLTNGQNFYVNAKSTKATALAKFKGFTIESVAWNNAQGDEASTKRILLGTTKGAIYEALLEDNKDKICKKLYDLNEPDSKEPQPISGLRIELFPHRAETDPDKFFVMAATPNRHYQFIGGPTFEAMFAKYLSSPANFVELPGSLGYSELRFYSKYQSKSPKATADTCAWLTGAGIYYGNLVFASQDQPGARVVDDGKLLAYPELDDGKGDFKSEGKKNSKDKDPLSLILSEFHFLLLTKRKLIAINQLSEEIVFVDTFDSEKYGDMRGLACDARKDTVWMFSDKFVFEIEIVEEDRDVWRLYLAEGKFANALEYCDNDQQRETVLNAQADHYFKQQNYDLSAGIYAKTQRSFEEVTLKFINSPVPAARRALKTYLLAKLAKLPATEMTQQTMICTWLTEIYLNNLNALQGGPVYLTSRSGGIEDTGISYPADPLSPAPTAKDREAYKEMEREFRQFLEDNLDAGLNKETTFELISSHGRVNELLFYAELLADWEWVLNHHIRQKDYMRALKVLTGLDKPAKYADIYYTLCPTLMFHLPRETVDMLIAVDERCMNKNLPRLDHSKLIPALMRYVNAMPFSSSVFTQADKERKEKKADAGSPDSKGDSKGSRNDDYDEESNQAIRFLDHCVRNRNRDPAIHNYLASLYAKLPSEKRLLEFIESQGSKPSYDYKYALRLCHQERKQAACVAIYANMELYEEAVKLALEFDINLAKTVAKSFQPKPGKPGSDPAAEQKRLWLLIARRVIDSNAPISRAMALLKECDLKLEDILPHFPDFVRIGEFKDEIKKSLEAYNQNIETLKKEMDEYTRSANLIRQDIADLRNRSGFVTSNQRCDLCSQPVLTRQFYLFPCAHVFHIDCITAEVKQYLDKNPRLKADVVAASGDGKGDASDSVDRDSVAAKGKGGSVSRDSATATKDAAAAAGGGGAGGLAAGGGPAATGGGRDVLARREARERRAIEHFASSECIFCGDMMIDSVQDPFVSLPDENAEAKSWEIFHGRG